MIWNIIYSMIVSITLELPNYIDNIKNIEEKYEVNYYAYLEIPTINFSEPLYQNSNLDTNIIFIKDSDLPTSKNANVIIAGHSGSQTVSHFKNLYKLKINDKITLEYDNWLYEYKIVKKYFIDKTGKAEIYKDSNKSTLALITCHGRNKQLVIISNLISKKKK